MSTERLNRLQARTGRQIDEGGVVVNTAGAAAAQKFSSQFYAYQKKLYTAMPEDNVLSAGVLVYTITAGASDITIADVKAFIQQHSFGLRVVLNATYTPGTDQPLFSSRLGDANLTSVLDKTTVAVTGGTVLADYELYDGRRDNGDLGLDHLLLEVPAGNTLSFELTNNGGTAADVNFVAIVTDFQRSAL